jgi:hypothetical protein
MAVQQIEDNVCDLCRKQFSPREKKRYYKLYNQGLTLKTHIRCFEVLKIWKNSRNTRMPISRLVYSIWVGIYRWSWADIIRTIDKVRKERK